MKIGEKVKAVVLASGVIQCLTTNEEAVKRALQADKYQNTKMPGTEVVQVVLVPADAVKKKIEWVVVDTHGLDDIVLTTRKLARQVCKNDKELGITSHIERREYVLASSKKVS